jgi:alpha-tubulin suppressor-like RCC1 family protein
MKQILKSGAICLIIGGLIAVPVRAAVRANAPVVQMDGGSYDSLFVESGGSLWGMGENYYGELGDGTTLPEFLPEKILFGDVTTAADGSDLGFDYSLFLETDGSLWGMGYNAHGQLGDGTTNNASYPEKIQASGVTAIAAGYGDSLFVKSDGSLWAMGNDYLGQLGDGRYTNSVQSPEKIVTDGVTAIASGQAYNLFLKSDGSLWGMGYNLSGELGLGPHFGGTNRPVKILSSGVTAIAAGYGHSLVLKSDGSLWAMGENQYGQLGDGTTNNSYVPEKTMDGGVVAIAAGEDHSLFLKSDGTLWAMGKNDHGELGDGATTNAWTPKEIVFNGVKAIAAGADHSLFVKSDGSLWGMGNSGQGRLGLGEDNAVLVETNPTPQEIVFVPFEPTLVANGGFEAASFTNWTRSGLAYSYLSTEYAHSGIYGLESGPVGSLGYLSQALATTPGQTYNLSFWLENDGRTPNEFQLSWADQALLDQTNLSAFEWTKYHFQTVATSVSTVLKFGFRNDNGYFGLDDVRVLPQPNLILNGGFETGNFTGWTTNGNFNNTYVSTYTYSGKYSAWLASDGSPGYLSQTLTTLPGDQYLVSFGLGNGSGATDQSFGVTWNGMTLLTNPPPVLYTNYQFVVIAENFSATLQFTFKIHLGEFLLDDVSVLPIPAMDESYFSGGNLTVHASNGQFGGNYSILASTNLALPLTNWTSVATTVLGASEPFFLTATNAMNPNLPRRFFRLRLQ